VRPGFVIIRDERLHMPIQRGFVEDNHMVRRKRVVLFGGQAFTLKPNNILESRMLGDTWEWDGENWTQVADIGPSQRFFHGMAYDHVRQTLILFGGRDSETRNDTWEWDAEFWTQLDDSGPPPRTQFGMAGDSRRQPIVIFGGEGNTVLHGGVETTDSIGYNVLGDTWEAFEAAPVG